MESILMETIVEEALAHAEASEEKSEDRNVRDLSSEDEELKEVLSSLKTDIKIIGVGGAGCNTIERMSEEGIQGAKLIAANTDAQHLLTVHAQRKILLGRRKTRGLGAGALPQVGMEATEEAAEDIKELLEGTDLVFVTCGLGGGTGTGGAPAIAKMAKEEGALTVAVCTTPFDAEGK